MVGRVVFAVASESDGAAQLAEDWACDRTGDLPHVQLPTVVSGVGRAESEALLERFIALRQGAHDPIAQWVRSLLPKPE